MILTLREKVGSMAEHFMTTTVRIDLEIKIAIDIMVLT